MKTLRLLLALAATVLFAAPAAADKDHMIYGGIFTTYTNMRIDYVRAYLYTPDSVLVDSMTTNPGIRKTAWRHTLSPSTATSPAASSASRRRATNRCPSVCPPTASGRAR